MNIKKYTHSKNVSVTKHFESREFASTVNGKLYSNEILIDLDFVKMLEKFFDYGITSVVILSGYRTPQADIAVGGNGCGTHTKGFAADIVCYKNKCALSSKYTACLAEIIGFSGIGITGDTGVHVDTRSARNYVNAHWFGDERNGKNDIKSFFSYFGLTKAELFGELEYYKQHIYTIKAKCKTAVFVYPSGDARIKKYYGKNKKARVWAQKNGYAKVLSGWIRLEDVKKV